MLQYKEYETVFNGALKYIIENNSVLSDGVKKK